MEKWRRCVWERDGFRLDKKEEERRQGSRQWGEDTTTVVCLQGRVVGVTVTKPSIFHLCSVPDLPPVPQSPGLDLGKHWVFVCMWVCVFLCLLASIISCYWVPGAPHQDNSLSIQSLKYTLYQKDTDEGIASLCYRVLMLQCIFNI